MSLGPGSWNSKSEVLVLGWNVWGLTISVRKRYVICYNVAERVEIQEAQLSLSDKPTGGCASKPCAIIGLKQQLSKIDNSSLNTTHSARNLGFIFDKHLTFSDQISSLSKSCYSHIRQLRSIRPYLDSKTASTIAASIVHSKLDYCNSLYYNLLKSQINRLRQIQNCLARTVVKAPKSSLVTPILRSLHLLNINERIEYKLLSLTYKVLTTSQADYLHNLMSVQSSGRTCSPSVVTLARPSVSSSLQITNRSFR